MAELPRPPPPPPQPGGPGAGGSLLAPAEPHDGELAALHPLPADVRRLAADASLAPGALDFLGFAVPTLAALWSYARWPLFGAQEAAASLSLE